jgi:hypothetical protein
VQIERLNTRVLHGINAIFHVIPFLYFLIFVNPWLGLCFPVIGRLVFDTFLNIFRKKGIYYIPENPKSIIDMVEKFTFSVIASLIDKLLSLFRKKKQNNQTTQPVKQFPYDLPTDTPFYRAIVGILPKLTYLTLVIVFYTFYIS